MTEVKQPIKEFERVSTLHLSQPQRFTSENAPDWLTSKDTIKGSTMDYRWFWEKHCLTLEVGQSVETDFSLITRVK